MSARFDAPAPQAAAPRRPRRILFVSYGSGHINALLPVILALRARHPDFHVDVLGLTTAAPKLAAMNIPYLGFKDFVRPGDEAALARGRALAADLPPHGQIDERETIAYLGISYQELVERLGPAAAAAAYATQGRMAFLPVRMLERILETLEPDLVIATNSPRAERAAIIAARKRGVPALCLGDLFLSFEIDWMKDHDYADRLLVLNQFVKNRLVDAGRPAEDIAVTGNPAFDPLARAEWADRARELRERRGWQERKVVLWMSQAMPWDPDGAKGLRDALIRAADERPDWQLVLRPHPNESAAAWRVPSHVAISDPREDPPAVILHATDVGATMFSTLGLEAVLLGVPVVSIAVAPPVASAYIDFERENFLRQMNLAIVVTDLAGVGPAIDRALTERPDHRAKLPPLGGATEAVIAEIESLLRLA